MPPKIRPKTAPNQHDKRHENGLAPPGKRVTKKASNGHLDGPPNGKPGSAGQTPAPPTVNVYPEGLTHGALDHAAPGEGAERDRTYSDASMEEGGQNCEAGDARAEDGMAMSSGEASTCKSAAPGHIGHSWAGMSTILAYYPLRDAISILILLLSLPPTLVLVIQTLFASLTFVPPTTTISLSTLPNIKEMFNSANMGYPALATILIVDLIFWILWLPLWKPMQGILLDLSQAVIAVSLSGAAATTGGPTYSIATCTTLVCIVHVLRYKAIHLTTLDYLRSVLHKVGFAVPLDVSSAASFVSLPSVDRGWLYTVFRTILGIHIVSQGVTTCIRRSLVKANEQGANVPAITKTDTEANAGADSNPRLSTGLVENSQHGVSAQSSDGRPPGPPPATRDSKARESSTKKKRKQANQVRSQQPLWAAIASTKVTFVKEMEQREAVDDAREASRMDTTTVNTFTSNTNQNTDCLWIRELRDTEVLFGVQLSSAVRAGGQANDGSELNAGIDSTKPFYVQINGAAWSSTRIMAVDDEYDEENRKKARYDGEIFGLAPRSTYECRIVAGGDHSVLCTVSVITQPAPSPEQAAAASSQPAHQGLRPASPITTLKQSIQTAELKLNETRNRNKKLRKDRRTEQGEIKREVGRLRAQLETSGGSDDRQRTKLAQANQHRTQAEESAADFKKQYDALGETPPEDIAQAEAARSNWRVAEGAKGEANRQLDNAKSTVDNEVNSLKSEISQTESRREKLATRHTQRTEELDKATTKAQADMTAKQKRDHERSQVKGKREKEQRDANNAIASLEQEAETLSFKTHDTYQQIGALNSWSQQQPPPYVSSPPTPDTNHPGAQASFGSPQTTAFPPFAQPFTSPLHSQPPSIVNLPGVPRGRSSSMLSQYSGFTEDGEHYSFAPELTRAQSTWPIHPGLNGAGLMDDRKESEGSGSASLNNDSTGSNSPRPEAKVFVPGKTPGVIGPIGPPGKSTEKSSQSPVTSPGTIGGGR